MYRDPNWKLSLYDSRDLDVTLPSVCINITHTSECQGCYPKPWVIDNPGKLDLLKGLLYREDLGPVGLDTETYGVDPTKESPAHKGRIFCWSLAYNDVGGVRGIFLPAWGPWGAEVLRELTPWLGDPAKRKVWHNGDGFDRQIFWNHGIEVASAHDTMTMSRLNNPGGRHGLKHLMRMLLRWHYADYKELFRARRVKEVKTEDADRWSYRKIDGQKVRSLVGAGEHHILGGFEQISLIDLPAKFLPTLIMYASLDAMAALRLYPLLRGWLQGR